MGSLNGGERIARVLAAQGVKVVYTLCGGHVAPILVGAKNAGLRVVDVRDEASAVFAADVTARLTGVPGVAVVTAGPGVTNALTALKNAQLAGSPLVLFGGATGTILRGRGALQDIDQHSLVASAVKWQTSVERVGDLERAVERAFAVAKSGVPGPTFVECPVDLLYDEALVRSWYLGSIKGKSLVEKATRGYFGFHLWRQFSEGGFASKFLGRKGTGWPALAIEPEPGAVRRAAALIAKAERPLLVVGSQAVLEVEHVPQVAAAIDALGIPTYLAGGARGLLGRNHPLQRRHKRREAMRGADLVILAGFPIDFRMEYGTQIRRSANLIRIGRPGEDLHQNRRPTLAAQADAGRFLRRLAERQAAGKMVPSHSKTSAWNSELLARDHQRDQEINQKAAQRLQAGINPIRLCQEIDAALADDSILVADGGDFVATAAYTVSPRRPLSWLDPGVFGTLGVGGGFALAAGVCRPNAETWLLWGDGSSAFSLAEFDSMARHGCPTIAVVGNDASWNQIAREQVEILGDAVSTELGFSDYHRVAEGYGGVGLRIDRDDQIAEALAEAKRLRANGKPVLINAILGQSDFRKGSISM